ncbi:MAG: hypothetical protein ACKOVA_00855, partial [Novosphingobium sp.]
INLAMTKMPVDKFDYAARVMARNCRGAGQDEVAVRGQGDHGFYCVDEPGHLPGPAVGNEYGPCRKNGGASFLQQGQGGRGAEFRGELRIERFLVQGDAKAIAVEPLTDQLFALSGCRRIAWKFA